MCDGDGGWDPDNLFRRRPLQTIQKLARVRGKCLNVAALAFGIERVERQAGLAAAAYAANHDQLAVRQVEVDMLQVVNFDAAK